MRLLLLFLFTFLVPIFSLAVPPSCDPVPQGTESNDWWFTRHRQKLAQIQEQGESIQVALIGDSITHYWETTGATTWIKYFCGNPYRAINLGFGADRTEHVLWRLENGELDGYHPKAIVMMIGTNNAGQRSEKQEPPGDTILGIKKLLDKIQEKQPEATIILCTISPRGETPEDSLNKRNQVVNTEIKKFCDGKKIVLCDWGNQLLDVHGKLTADMAYDYLHPTASGYKIWVNNLLPLLHKAVYEGAEKPETAIPQPREDRTYWASISYVRNQVYDKSGLTIDVGIAGDDVMYGLYSQANSVRKDILGKRTDMQLALKDDKIQNIAWRLKNGELHAYTLRSIIVNAGSANTNNTPEEVVEGLKALAAIIRERQPRARILFTALPPKGRTAEDPRRAWITSVNESAKELADNRFIFWVDSTEDLLEADGTLSEECSQDGVTLTVEGYKRFTEKIKNWLNANL